ncbi:hypothetical protein COW81_01460 [Candidatus Campbellbacteria bacterium CG22_combo_CG10-13_8_21_14_all_36_13]|uniref:Uncharacterized protein n=1 Tax=Candidatus Campbellbacteria bacterium CG22_combo_CG10-13_8_21_14_all_36_13 TaxID=1974529 RepID=A0A2H0DYF2_9BACT|nr:MAG: hypothetical protein COW81_01460 [Candidatus Campbellbacteria bacterium CG22_combo_CG10-13_8_21_14_all_36_13]
MRIIEYLVRNVPQKGYDVEIIQYNILAYIVKIHRNFVSNMLFPHLHEIRSQIKELKGILEYLSEIEESGYWNVNQIDMFTGEIKRDYSFLDNINHDLLKEMIVWSISELEKIEVEGSALGEFFFQSLHISPVGVIPTTFEYGYFSYSSASSTGYFVIRYRVLNMLNVLESSLSLVLKCASVGFFDGQISLFDLKKLITQNHDSLPNPAFLHIEDKIGLPIEQTLEPLCRRKLLAFVVDNKLV